jgi:integrase/recombinase XerC/integrase/recombinase XerD
VAKLTLRDLIGYWEFHNRTEGKSPRTVDWYNQVLDLFERFLERERRSPLIDDIGEDEVRTFIAHLQQSPGRKNGSGPAPQGQSPETIQNRIRALKAFFAWLHRDGYTETYRLERLKNYKVPQTVKEVLTEDEIRRVLGCIDVREHWGARDYAIVMLMLDSGLRLSEVTGLQARDVELVDGFLKVMGKGSKERIVPFGAATQKALWRYQQQFRPEAELDDHFFRTLDGRPMRGETLRSIIKRLGERSGVPRLHPHLCRHTFATRYLINGGDVFSLQQILGHSTLEMVRRYVNLASAHVAVQHRKFSPMDHVALGRGSANGR